jgi:hypothetical protein
MSNSNGYVIKTNINDVCEVSFEQEMSWGKIETAMVHILIAKATVEGCEFKVFSDDMQYVSDGHLTFKDALEDVVDEFYRRIKNWEDVAKQPCHDDYVEEDAEAKHWDNLATHNERFCD